MAAEPKRISVPANSELGRLLEEATLATLVLESNGALYRINRMEREHEDIWAGYDPKKVRETIKKTAGAWADLDAKDMIEGVYRAREDGSRANNRP